MRVSELAEVCHLTLSGMPRVVIRLEKQGFVQRVRCAEDLRGWNAVLTDEGPARLQEAWPAHLASVRRRVLDNLAGFDLAQLATALRHSRRPAEARASRYSMDLPLLRSERVLARGGALPTVVWDQDRKTACDAPLRTPAKSGGFDPARGRCRARGRRVAGRGQPRHGTR
ncbi:MarR family winged helix-turn-helix transcriptional regulator [Streptomyces sp. NPDC054804]